VLKLKLLKNYIKKIHAEIRKNPTKAKKAKKAKTKHVQDPKEKKMFGLSMEKNTEKILRFPDKKEGKELMTK